jgi:ubiquitin-like domain-containing CTD phosphatase 1
VLFQKVQAKRQKIIGFNAKAGKATDETKLGECKIPKLPFKFMMVGSKEDSILPERADVGELPEIIDDFDLDFALDEAQIEFEAECRKKLAKRIKSCEVHVMNPPRPGKKLLVLDLDCTLLDFKAPSGNPVDMKRPFTDWFLEKLYPYYDFVIWSQTSWVWLEVKLTALGLLASDKFSFAFVLDRSSMFPIVSRLKDGSEKKHEVKPLEFIWQKFPAYSKDNTVHLDDLNRNFALNP